MATFFKEEELIEKARNNEFLMDCMKWQKVGVDLFDTIKDVDGNVITNFQMLAKINGVDKSQILEEFDGCDQRFVDALNTLLSESPIYAYHRGEDDETYDDWRYCTCEMLDQIASDHFDDFHCTPFGFEWKELAHLNADPKVLGLLHLDNEGMGLSKDYHELHGITYEKTHTMQYGVYKTTVWVVRSL